MEIAWTQEYQQEMASGRQISKPAFQPGDMVLLNEKNIRTQLLAVKLDNRPLRPFPITEIIRSSAYCLKLLTSINIYLVFSVSLLELALNN